MAGERAWKRKLRGMAHRSVKDLVGAGTEHIEIAHATDEDGDLELCTFDASEGWKAKRPRLLAGPDNPNGYASVFEVVEQLLEEIHEKLRQCSGGGVLQ